MILKLCLGCILYKGLVWSTGTHVGGLVLFESVENNEMRVRSKNKKIITIIWEYREAEECEKLKI